MENQTRIYGAVLCEVNLVAFRREVGGPFSEPAAFLRLNAGSLEEGKDADMVMIDLTRPNLIPSRMDNIVENLIWASDGSEVKTVVAKDNI
jgi:hypothetical protein